MNFFLISSRFSKRTKHTKLLNPSSVHLFSTIVSVLGGGVHHPYYLKFQTWYEVEICTRDTTCELITIDDVTDWVT